MAEFLKNWSERAACKDDPDRMFVAGAAQNDAKRICGSCVVKTDCLAEALDNRIEFGVWGGMTERQRRALLRRHPQVSSWHDLFQAALKAEAARTAGQGGNPAAVAGAAGAMAMGAELPESVQPPPGSRTAAPEGSPNRDS